MASDTPKNRLWLATLLVQCGDLTDAESTLDHPNAQGLRFPNQRQQRGNPIRRTAHIGGIAAKELCKARIVKTLVQKLRKRLAGAMRGKSHGRSAT